MCNVIQANAAFHWSPVSGVTGNSRWFVRVWDRKCENVTKCIVRYVCNFSAVMICYAYLLFIMRTTAPMIPCCFFLLFCLRDPWWQKSHPVPLNFTNVHRPTLKATSVRLVWLISLRPVCWPDRNVLITLRPTQWHQHVTCAGVCVADGI